MIEKTTYVIMAGLPGTGKTTLARALASELAGVVLSKDEVRAALFPGALTDYSREQDGLCFDAVLRAAEYLARRRRTEWIFLDGRTFSRAAQVEQVVRAAEAAGCEWKILHLTAPDEVAESRLAAARGNHPAGNRDVELFREIKARFEPIVYPKLEIDTSRESADCFRDALAYLRRGKDGMRP